jgi:putative oxidoreductase
MLLTSSFSCWPSKLIIHKDKIMKKLLYYLTAQPSSWFVQLVLCGLRMCIGILTVGHGLPKILGGIETWHQLGTFMVPLGIHFLPTVWGFAAACTEFFGGIALILGLKTRLVSALLTFMMFVATMWHLSNGDPYKAYSFPLTLIVIFITFMLIGGGPLSIDHCIHKRL